ncbi:MAG: T9SS type A sorting domain-containing protein [Bacteroidales bacterium]|nr:T9SS type A sorting domain-containing protein [Bacteroidales bacterium]
MKKIVLLIGMVMMFVFAYAQMNMVADVKFNTIPAGWTVSPSGGWGLDNGLFVSSPSSAVGYVPNSTGDSVVLTSPYYDFTNYQFVFLRFSHICKVSTSDICKVYIQENYTGARWVELPTSSYQGASATAYQNARFSQQSYLDWVPTDSLATPTNAWWKVEPFDLSNEASYAQVRFKFVIKRGNVLGTQFAYGWLLDNFELMGSQYQIKPPIIQDLSNIGDTVYTTGPFPIQIRISPQTIHPMVRPIYLTVRYERQGYTTTYDTIAMTMIDGDTIFGAMLPQKVAGTTITYDVYAYDTVGNNGSLHSSFYIQQRAGGGLTGHVIIGTGGTTESYCPMYYNYDYGWSRQLYLASEISSASAGGMITTMAFYPSSTWAINSQSCYFKAVSDNAIASAIWEDPTTNGATLVWSGTYNVTANSWSDIPLTNSFMLAPGMNLMVYWLNNEGSYGNNTSTYWRATSTSPTYKAVYKYQDGSFPASAGSLYYYRPDIRFYIMGGSDDTNSVGLYEVNSPLDSVVAAPLHQVPVIVTIKNQGMGDLDSCLINWTLNGVLQPSFTWRGYLPWDFNATDTIGYYTPSVNQYDTLVIWTSLPNGVYDSTTYDDTVTQISFGVTGLNMWLLSNITDTLYNTGPFKVQAHISSRTATPVPTPVYMHVAYTYNSITTYDTILMNYVSNDTFVGMIPQHVFGTAVSYSISVMDAVGNLVTIGDNFVIHRLSGGASTGYVIVGTGTNTQYYVPFYRWYDYSWSRTLYLASELSPSSSGGMITKLAWQVATTGVSGTNQTCYFKEVTDNMMMTTNYLNPVTDGATLVWSGTYSPSTTGWVEITLTNSFTLTPNKNLMIYWENNDGAYTSPYAEWYSTTTSNPMAVYDYADMTFPTYSGSYSYDRPNARFYIIGAGNDTNSVAMLSIDYPQGSVMATPNGDSVGVKVTIKNKGIANLTSCNVSWELNGVYQGTKAWSGNLTEDFNDTLTVGYYMPRACVTDYIRVWVSNPNGVNDPTKYDDTLSTSIYGEAAIEVTLSGPVDTIYHTGPYQIDAKLISLTSLPVDTNVFLHVSYTYAGLTTYDTIRMNNTGNDTLWRTILPQQPYTSHVTYSISATDSLGNIIEIVKWFYVKRPDASNSTDSIIIGTVLNGGVFVVPFDCRYAASYSRVLYTGAELGVSTTGAMISSIAWKSYQNAGYTYSAIRTNQDVYMKAVDLTVTAITSGTYVDPITDGAVLVWSGSMNLDATPGVWHKIDLLNPFLLPANKNIIVYYVDQHGTAAATFAWNYYNVTGTSCYGYGTSLTNLTTQSTSSYRPWTCFGFSGATNDSDGVATYRILSPENVTPAGVSTPVTAVIKNKGMRNLTSCKIDWTLNGIAQTQYNWTGNLYEDFTDTVVLGSYMPNPANYDNIKVWVSLPNGAADTSNFDDTLSVNAYAKAGLIAEYLSPLVRDTVFVTGPFEILAHIQSTTSIPLPTPVMHLSYTYNNVTTYDTVTMSIVHADSIFKVTIPQQPFGTYVTYSVTVVDSIGNVITISDWFYVKRSSGGANTGYVIVGTGMNTSYMLPMDMWYCYSWTRELYLANELSPSSGGGLITKLAWQYAYATPYTYTNQTCFFEAVDASVTSITSNAYVDPAISGATQVWTGTAYLSQGWVEFVLDQPFMLPPGKNLLIHWHHKHGTYPGTAYTFYYTPTIANTAVYCRADGSFPSASSGTLTVNRPNARFYIIGGGDDTNSVGITQILSPDDTIQAYTNTPVEVVIKNKGIANLTSCKIDWMINGVPQPTYNWTGNLFEDFMDTVTIGYFTPIQGYTYTISFQVSLPNNAFDSTTYDDTLSITTYADFHGVNITMRQFMSPYNNPSQVCFGNTTPVSIRMENTGTLALILNASPITLHYNVTGPVSYQKNVVLSKGAFPVGTKDVIVDTLFDISLPGIYQMEVYLTCASDTIRFDDTIRMQYEVRRILLPYDEDFSSALTSIRVVQNAGPISWAQDSTPGMTPVFGTGALYYNSSVSAGSVSSAILHAINLQGALDPIMEFWFAHDANNSTKTDRVALKISTNGGASYTTLQTINRYDPTYTTPGWKKYTIDLSNFISESCVILAFEAHSEGGGDMYIDRIFITSSKEMGIGMTIPQIDDLVACDLNNQEIKVTLMNNTLLPIDFSETPSILTVEVTGTVTTTYTDTLSGVLLGNATMDVIVDNAFDVTTSGTYDFKAYVSSIDNASYNDTVMSTLTISAGVSLVSLDAIGSRPMHSQVYPTIKISNTGNLRVQEVPLRIQVDGVQEVTEIAHLDLLAGTDTLYTMKTPYIVPIEPTYALMIVSELSCDNDNSNDTLRSTETVNEPTLKVQSVLRPSATVCDTGLHVVNPQITINNTGAAETDVVVYMTLDTGSVVFESFIDTIAFVLSGTTNYNFTSSYIVPNMATNSTYNVTAYIYSPTYALEQTACVIYNDVSVIDVTGTAWTMEQNIPNPATASTLIPYSIPQDGKLIFKVMSINGQVLYKEDIQAVSGTHYVELKTESIANGIYYYSMEYEGQTIVKKMTIQK